MALWRKITKTVPCLSCTANPNTSLDETFPVERPAQSTLASDAVRMPSGRPLQTRSSPNAPGGKREQQATVAGTPPVSTSLTDSAAGAQPPQPSQLSGTSGTSPVLEKPESAESTGESTNVAVAGHRTSSAAIDMAIGSLLSVLKVAKEASTSLPPLDAALGAIVASIEVYSVSTDLLDVSTASSSNLR